MSSMICLVKQNDKAECVKFARQQLWQMQRSSGLHLCIIILALLDNFRLDFRYVPITPENMMVEANWTAVNVLVPHGSCHG